MFRKVRPRTFRRDIAHLSLQVRDGERVHLLVTNEDTKVPSYVLLGVLDLNQQLRRLSPPPCVAVSYLLPCFVPSASKVPSKVIIITCAHPPRTHVRPDTYYY